MQSLLLLFSFTALYSAEPKVCEKYSCSNDIAALSDHSVCAATDEKTNPQTRHGRVCNSGFYCDAVQEGLSYCTPNPPAKPIKLGNGITCKYNDDCGSNLCVEAICIRSAPGLSCTETGECDAGYYCDENTSKCKYLIQEGHYGCRNEYECAIGLSCNATSKTDLIQNGCVRVFSVDLMERVAHPVSGAQENNICKSSWAYYNSSLGHTVCADAPKYQTFPMDCSLDDSVCADKDSCECAYNAVGSAHCAVLMGDEPYTDLLDKYREFFKKDRKIWCNSRLRYDYECIKTWWGGSEANEVFYLASKVFFYPKIFDAESCIMEIFVPWYYKWHEAYDDSSSIPLVLFSLLLFN